MNDRDKIILRKISSYIAEIFLYIQNMDFAAFKKDNKTVNATAFVLGQIGELANLVSKETQNDNPQISWRGIRGLRNRIVHDYENLDMKMFWDVLCDDLPKLDKQLKEIVPSAKVANLKP